MMKSTLLICGISMVHSGFFGSSGKSKSTQKSQTNCNVDSNNDILSGVSLCSDLIIETDSEYNEISQNQYASTSFPENVSPSMILMADPSCNDDIKTVLNYASNCGYSVVMRSGGHQFSGLSSCTDQCIQIDLSSYNTTEMVDSSNFNQYENVIKAGVGTELQQLYSFLDDNGLFIPGGATTTIGIGGHFQTGGIGYLLRSHGAFTDYVIGFDITLADGKSKLVTKDNDYKNLFYSVRGGGPGSFGVVTNLYLSAIPNSDYPNNAIGVQSIWLYSDEDARAIAKQWTAFQSDLNYTEYDDFFPLFAIAPDLTTGGHIILIAFIWIDDVNGRGYNDFGKSYFMQPFLDSAPNAPVQYFEIPGTVSSLMNAFLNPSPEIAPIPYTLKANGITQSWDDDFIDILIDNVTDIIGYSNINGNVFVNLLFEAYGGMFLKNDPDKSLSALPFRDLSMLLAVQLFYTDSDGQQYAQNYLDQTFTQYRSLDTWNNEDIRAWGYTFGELDMEVEKENLNYYIDQTVFDGITQIKENVDQCNVFRNKFTVPLPDIDADDIDDLDIDDLTAKDMLRMKQWANRFYYELDKYTSTSDSGNNGDCTDLTEYIEANTIPQVKAIATGDIAGIWRGRSEFTGLFCGLFGPFTDEDHFQSTISFLSYQKIKNKRNKCKFEEKEIVKMASKTFIYSIVTFEGNVRATFINRNEFEFVRYKNGKKWLLSQWDVDVERVNITNLG